MIWVTGAARVPARKINDSGLIFTVIAVSIGGTVRRCAERSVPPMTIRHFVADG